jgi:hypothetical protein
MENGNPLPSVSGNAATGRGVGVGIGPTFGNYSAPTATRATVTALAYHVAETDRLVAQIAGVERGQTHRPMCHLYDTQSLETIARLAGKQVICRRIGNFNDWMVIVDGVEFWSSSNTKRQ